MTLELLISTIDAGLERLKDSLLPERSDVRYLILWQYTGVLPEIPLWLSERNDVRVFLLKGRGLCRSRNHTLDHARGDILKVCDDDEHWEGADFDTILDTYRRHPDYDIVHFQVRGLQKKYPPRYVSSIELTMRRSSLGRLRFDERFGLGSENLSACEETVFLHDAHRLGLSIHYVPLPVSSTQSTSTGAQWHSPLLQRSKGAMFCLTRGYPYAIYKSLRESLGLMLRKRVNPLSPLRNMLWGANYIRSCRQ